MLSSRYFQANTLNALYFRGGLVVVGDILKYWDGATWINAKLKVYTGGSWQLKPLKYWDGSAWKNVNSSG